MTRTPACFLESIARRFSRQHHSRLFQQAFERAEEIGGHGAVHGAVVGG